MGAGDLGLGVDWRDEAWRESKGWALTRVIASSESLLAAAIVASAMCALVAGVVGHGVLRPMMEARDVSPWAVRDSLGSMPLVLIGAALIGASGAVGSGWLWCVREAIIPTVLVVAAGVLFLLGLLMLRLGLLALRKLT